MLYFDMDKAEKEWAGVVSQYENGYITRSEFLIAALAADKSCPPLYATVAAAQHLAREAIELDKKGRYIADVVVNHGEYP